MKRRDLIKGITMLPLAGGVMASGLPIPAAAAPGLVDGVPVTGQLAAMEAAGINDPIVPGPQIFQSLGVEPLINCMGTYTIIGGSLERPSVRASMDAASRNFVQYDELATGIGQRLADLTGAEWGMVSAGCAAGLKHVTAACVTGGNPEKLIRIPDLRGFEKDEVVVPMRSRNEYDHAIRNVGVKMINVETIEELEAALSKRTAMIYLKAEMQAPLNLEAIAKVAKPKNIPILVDAAAENLTVPNVHLQKGATIVAYSGGKALCGPQCSGILLGEKDILLSAWQASAPHHGPGRDNKVGREEMIGALAAVEAWLTMDHKAQWNTWLSYLNTVSKRVSQVDGVKATIFEPPGLANHSPVLIISWDPKKLHITGEEMAEELGRNKPRIALASGPNRSKIAEGLTAIHVTAGQMQAGEDVIVGNRIFGVLNQKRSPKPSSLDAPAANLKGQWEVNIEFYSSNALYTWVIEQDGNWLQGTHTGPFITKDLAGAIEGDQIKVRSAHAYPGDHISFTYTGKISNDVISGTVYMVEYGVARFTAKRHNYKDGRQPIVVPGGPPLAT